MIDSWQFNLIVSLISSIFFFQCYKLAVRRAKNDGAATIIIQTIAGVSMLVLIPFFSIKFPHDPRIYFFLFLTSVFFTVYDRLQTTARKHLDVSTYSILSQLSSVFLILYGFIMFREPVILQKIVGASLIIGGNVIVFYRKGALAVNKYIWMSILAAFFLATAISIDIGYSKHFSLHLYVAATFLIPAAMLMLAERLPVRTIMHELQELHVPFTVVTGIAWASMAYFSLRAFQLGSVSTIVPLQATAVLINVVVAYTFLNERSDVFKKIIAAVIVIAGIILTVQ